MPFHRDNKVVKLTEEDEIIEEHSFEDLIERHDANMTACCVPTSCFLDQSINTEKLESVVRVICNNDQCQEGVYMHKECFEEWQESVLTYLRSTGRARSWSEKQRRQNLWTKKGYDLAYKACSCKCQKGHLRKDLDWNPPKQEDTSKKKKGRKKSRQETKPVIIATGGRSESRVLRIRTNSVSSTGSGSSPPTAGSMDSPVSPSYFHWGASLKSKFDFVTDRNAAIFNKRQDFSSFNVLPKHKINSYHIKIDDDGNDDVRSLLLSSLAAVKSNRTECILCQSKMLVFDRYPLIDGTFFLSPRQHTNVGIQVTVDGKALYLYAVCLGCLEGWTSRIYCRFCFTEWKGSSLILGTMYSYDIFAAVPCCMEKLGCNDCGQPVISADQRFQYFSDYSHTISCPACSVSDFHFVKSLSSYCRRRDI